MFFFFALMLVQPWVDTVRSVDLNSFIASTARFLIRPSLPSLLATQSMLTPAQLQAAVAILGHARWSADNYQMVGWASNGQIGITLQDNI